MFWIYSDQGCVTVRSGQIKMCVEVQCYILIYEKKTFYEALHVKFNVHGNDLMLTNTNGILC